MKKTFGYVLIGLGVIGIITSTLTITYLLFIAFIFCPIQQCWGSRIGLILMEAIALFLGLWLIRTGKKLSSRRKLI